MRIVASLTESCNEGLATMLCGSAIFGRYLTFSWKWLIKVVSFCFSVEYFEDRSYSFDASGIVTCSSYTHICTSRSNTSGCCFVFSATTLAMVVPLHAEHWCQLRQPAVELTEAHQLPDPTIVTLCFCSWAPKVAMVLGEV